MHLSKRRYPLEGDINIQLFCRGLVCQFLLAQDAKICSAFMSSHPPTQAGSHIHVPLLSTHVCGLCEICSIDRITQPCCKAGRHSGTAYCSVYSLHVSASLHTLVKHCLPSSRGVLTELIHFKRLELLLTTANNLHSATSDIPRPILRCSRACIAICKNFA